MPSESDLFNVENWRGQVDSPGAEPAGDCPGLVSRAFLAAIVESSDDSIISTDLVGRIVSWNRGAHRMFGYSAEEAVGQPVTILFPPDRTTDLLNVLDKVRQGERIERYESVRIAKDGTPIDVAVILSPVKDEAGELVGVSAIYRDITLRKLRQEQLMRAKETAEAANRAKSEFLANISHEIRTPMNGILGMTEVLLDTEPTPEQREYLDIIHFSANSLLTIISDILDFSKMEADQLKLTRKEVRVRDLVGAAIREMEVLAKTKGLMLAGVVAAGTPEIMLGDPARLRQVLVSLVGNAVKFTDSGNVELTVRPSPEAPERLHFQVTDTGPGIPPDMRTRIFEAFTQVDGSLTRRAGGTGLGLAIAARLVELMGGRMQVESDGSSGSTFHFTIPTHNENSVDEELSALAEITHAAGDGAE